jgi:hypothetical protein
MATRMQQRRGTAAQWISTNGGAGPVLNAGEMGWESDTNKFKIGDGVNNWTSLDYFSDINSTVNPAFGSSISFEGATANDFETTLAITDPTADRTITIPDATGTVQLRVTDVSDTEIGYLNGVTSAIQTQLDDKSTASKTETLTNKTITSPVISSITNGAATLTLPSSTGTIALTTDIPAGVVTDSGTQTLTNKTLTSPVVSGLILSDSSIVIEGSTANDFETTLTVTDPTADRTITIPDVTGTVVTTGNLSAITSVGTLASLTVTGDLTVNGTTTTINSTTLTIDDKNIVLGDVETPTDTTADGGGITLKGATDKTFNWVDATDSWTSSEHLFLSATKELRLADTDSSHYVGFKSPGTVTANKVWVLPAADGTAGQALSTDGSGNLSWATSGGGAAFSEFMLIGA